MTGWYLAALLYLYAGWAFAEVTVAFDRDLSRENVRKFTYVLTFVAWPLIMPWVPWYGVRRLRRKMGAGRK